MDLMDQNREFDKKRYKEQANIVYISTFIAFFFIIPLFYFSGNTIILAISFFSMAVAVFVFYLNRKERYGLASLIFIATMTIQTTIEIILFGLEPGFGYYYFNMSVLIVYAQWKGWMKLLGVSIEALLFVTLFILYQNRAPITQMSQWLTLTFHTINVIFNVVGVANSSNFYQIIATNAHKKISQLATTDYLTNVPNRTAFGTYLNLMAKQHKKHAEAAGIMMIDIDHFKNINDTYGHVTGDVILKETAKTAVPAKIESIAKKFAGKAVRKNTGLQQENGEIKNAETENTEE